MSKWIHFVKGAGILALCLAGAGSAYAEPVLDYSFVVVIGYDKINPEGLEISYKSMEECKVGQARVEKKLEEEKDEKLFYIIIDCVRIEEEE